MREIAGETDRGHSGGTVTISTWSWNRSICATSWCAVSEGDRVQPASDGAARRPEVARVTRRQHDDAFGAKL